MNVFPPQLVIYDLDKKTIVKNYKVPYGVHGIFPIGNDPNHAILFGPDVYKMNLKTGELKTIMSGLHPKEGQEVRFVGAWYINNSPGDHGLLAAPFYAKSGLSFLMLDTQNGSIQTIKSKKMSMPFSAAVSPDKKFIYAGHDELIKVDVSTGETVKSTHADMGTFSSICFSPDGKKVYIGAFGADVSIYDADTLELETVIPLGGDASVFTQFSR